MLLCIKISLCCSFSFTISFSTPALTSGPSPHREQSETWGRITLGSSSEATFYCHSQRWQKATVGENTSSGVWLRWPFGAAPLWGAGPLRLMVPWGCQLHAVSQLGLRSLPYLSWPGWKKAEHSPEQPKRWESGSKLLCHICWILNTSGEKRHTIIIISLPCAWITASFCVYYFCFLLFSSYCYSWCEQRRRPGASCSGCPAHVGYHWGVLWYSN